MAAAERVTGKRGAASWRAVALLRIAIIAIVALAWEVLAASGLLFRDVVPSLRRDRQRGRSRCSPTPDFYRNLGDHRRRRSRAALAIGGLAGLGVGILLGANRFLSRAYESLIYYLGPTPKIIFFPVMIMWFGVGSGSKIAMGVLSCFFPIAISAAAGMRQIDPC